MTAPSPSASRKWPSDPYTQYRKPDHRSYGFAQGTNLVPAGSGFLGGTLRYWKSYGSGEKVQSSFRTKESGGADKRIACDTVRAAAGLHYEVSGLTLTTAGQLASTCPVRAGST